MTTARLLDWWLEDTALPYLSDYLTSHTHSPLPDASLTRQVNQSIYPSSYLSQSFCFSSAPLSHLCSLPLYPSSRPSVAIDLGLFVVTSER